MLKKKPAAKNDRSPMLPPDKATGKKGLIPKLRFPEFRDTEGWEETPMGEAYSFKGNNSLSRKKLNYERGLVKNIHYGDIHTKFSTLFDITKEIVPYINPSESLAGFRAENDCAEGDMVFADASEDMIDIGKSIELVRLNGERVVSGLHTILARRNDDHIIVGFGAHLFKSNGVRVQIQRESQGAKVLGVSATRLAKIKLPIPQTKGEQQKIADCLTSLDELIAAQSQKIAALKTHKKGLMQQLFPRKGETLPRLRFPEFQGVPEWEEDTLGNLFYFQDGFSFKSTDFINSSDEAIQVIRITDINNKNTNDDKVYIPNSFPDLDDLEKYYVESGDLLLSLTGAAGFNFFIWNGDKSLINQRTTKITPKNKSNNALSQLLEALIYDKINARGEGQNNNLSKDFLNGVILQIPKPAEQKQIADCLTALDDQITAQTQKLETLKTHKKGLMQQLFPNP